ncbi:MAG TPA: polysaccharide deacetylase family protein [Puia sp.]|jgi:peptidoglycan/xylan/chitin deacetylase (PgdA/CDA1 family)|nr:polysaccharide deacetylase family protein [Puia sp.]
MKLFICCFFLFIVSCQSLPDNRISAAFTQGTTASFTGALAASAGDEESSNPAELRPVFTTPRASAILSKKQVPILCYHQIRDWKPTDSRISRDYIVPPAMFAAQMRMLADSGYHTITPDQLYAYLITGTRLPVKPIILSFDDTDLDQFTVAYPEMKKYGFKGLFFIMTVSLGKPHYMSKEQVRTLSDDGNTIGSHTWDHHNVKKYQGNDWVTQLDKPTKTLEQITGKNIRYFAYPFGLWNTAAFPELKKRGFVAAFQLNEKSDREDPLYCIRRIIVPGTWTGAALNQGIARDF